MSNTTNEQRLRQQEEELMKDLGTRVDSDDLPTANILVAGITGTGKSTLINAVFGENTAKTGSGRPVTERIDEYGSDADKIHIWDTVGLELDSAKTKESIASIRATIASKNTSKDLYDRIHAIWYCINSGSKRYQGAELDFIKQLHDIGVPFIIVLTQCSGAEEEVDAFEATIREINSSMGLSDIDIVQVLAQDVKFRGMPEPIPAFGLDNLVETTLNKLPSFIKNGFIAAQRVSQVEKRKACEDIIFEYVDLARMGFWDKVPIINVFTADNKITKMFIKIGKLYNTILPDSDTQKMIKDLGHIDIENGFFGLINPTRKYDKKVDNLFRKKRDEGYNVQLEKLENKERVARLLALYGYIFLDAIEEVWSKLTEEQLKEIDMVMDMLRGVLKRKFSRKHADRRES